MPLMTVRSSIRAWYVAVAVTTIVLGLWIHRDGIPMGVVARDFLGDALWAMMIAWWIAALAPDARVLARGAVALGICFAVEFGQLLHIPELDAFRRTVFGHLVLGTGFDPRDLVAYASGILGAVLFERLLRPRCFHRKRRPLKLWYSVPFMEGEKYVATRDILGLCEQLIYRSTGYSRYDGYIGFFFADTAGADRRWDIYEDQDPLVEARKAFCRFPQSEIPS